MTRTDCRLQLLSGKGHPPSVVIVPRGTTRALSNSATRPETDTVACSRGSVVPFGVEQQNATIPDAECVGLKPVHSVVWALFVGPRIRCPGPSGSHQGTPRTSMTAAATKTSAKSTLIRPRTEARRRSASAPRERGSAAMALVARGPTRKS